MIPIKPIGQGIPANTEPRSPATAALQYLQPGSLNLAALPPLSLYIHWPWCVRKCPYCDFNSHESNGPIPEAEYLDALRADLEQSLPLIWGRKIHTIFIGGGTPSLMSAASLDRLLSDVRTLLPLEINAEITMEANPGTFEAEKFKAYRASGVNRLSIGIQSFNGRHLQALGRIHDENEARKRGRDRARELRQFQPRPDVRAARQTLEEAQRDIDTALAFAPPHLSLYHLTMEPNTVFAKYPPQLPSDDESADIQDMIFEKMAGGRVRALRGVGVCEAGAPGAPQPELLDLRRLPRHRRRRPLEAVLPAPRAAPGALQAAGLLHRGGKEGQSGARGARDRTRGDLGFEFMLNALRLTGGFDPNLFGERTGLSITAIEKALNEAEGKGLIYRDFKLIRPTRAGTALPERPAGDVPG
jgi:coproporphyrinogen III oxidase-like Fe-S oxidoreductase